MGIFDSVHVKCPTCGKRSELQTKVRCEMGSYAGENVPADIAIGVSGARFDCCGETWEVQAPHMPRVALLVRALGEEAADDSGNFD